MTRLKTIWNDWNREHVKKHGVSVQEVEKLVRSGFLTSSGHSGRSILTARVGHRILTAVVNFENKGLYIVTASSTIGLLSLLVILVRLSVWAPIVIAFFPSPAFFFV